MNKHFLFCNYIFTSGVSTETSGNFNVFLEIFNKSSMFFKNYFNHISSWLQTKFYHVVSFFPETNSPQNQKRLVKLSG